MFEYMSLQIFEALNFEQVISVEELFALILMIVEMGYV